MKEERRTAPPPDALGPPGQTAGRVRRRIGSELVDLTEFQFHRRRPAEDRDGDLDVISASLSDNMVEWHENNGSQQFTRRCGIARRNDWNAKGPHAARWLVWNVAPARLLWAVGVH